jgi:V/A-type H+-transporting ATPase subunit D
VGKIKLTKNELKRQKDALKRYLRYLPTLLLKKQQLQMEIRKVEAQEQEAGARREASFTALQSWIAVFGEAAEAGLTEAISVTELRTQTGNIAGVDIPLFDALQFKEQPYDLLRAPLWLDAGVDKVKDLAALDAQIHVLRQQAALLGEELRVTSQRVNLFEKVKIPETREHIRRIQIYLGDEQTAAVVRGKIAKAKLVRVNA